MPGIGLPYEEPNPSNWGCHRVTPWPSQRVWGLVMRKIPWILNSRRNSIPQPAANIPNPHFLPSTGWCPQLLPGNQGLLHFPRPKQSQKIQFLFIGGESSQDRNKKAGDFQEAPAFPGEREAWADPDSHHSSPQASKTKWAQGWALGLFSAGFFLICVLPFFLKQHFWVLIWGRAEPGAGIPPILTALGQI